MNDLSGRCVNVVLAIEMGRGMGFLDHPIKIVANFNGRPLESDLTEPEECPLFNTELVWETEKKELRKARSANAPLRVEVMLIDRNQRKDRVGFILLSPRCASIIPFESKTEIPFKWQKLLGVTPEHKSSHPELYLSLTIRDASMEMQGELPYLMTVEEHDEADVDKEDFFEYGGQKIPIQYLLDGFVQIGNDECNETFTLNITLQVAYNLDLLLPEVLVFHQSKEKYFMSFRMFGITIRSKPFCRDLHANIPMNEKIVVRIRSVYEILQLYFTEHCRIIVCFYCGRDKLGMTNLATNSLLKEMTEQDFMMQESVSRCEQKCFFKLPSEDGIIPVGTNDRQPFIEVATVLKRNEIHSKYLSADVTVVENENTEQGNETPNSTSTELLKVTISCPVLNESVAQNAKEEAPPPQQSLSRNLADGCGDNGEKSRSERSSPRMSPCGDQIDEPEVLSEPEPPKPEAENIIEIPGSETQHFSESKSSESILKNTIPSSDPTIKSEDIEKNIEMYQQYCLDVILENITFKRIIKAEKLFLKFKHPKASAVTIAMEIENQDDLVGEDILLENTRCKVFFVSTTEHIRKMVYAWAPKLILTDENNQILTEELDLYTAMFLAKQRTECSYVTEWKAIRTYEALAKISISMYLREYGLEAFPKPTEFDLLPPIVDEEVVIKELQELQRWKQLQKTQFMADLKIMKKQQMMKLQKDWAKRKKQLEGKLSQSVSRCQNLTQELQAAVNTIRTKKALQLKESELDSKPDCSFEDILDKNLLKYSESEKRVVIEQVSKLERENRNLEEIINDQRHQMQQIKKTALTKEQTTSLLQQLKGLEEKFEEAQKAKSYFKDQWKKAVKEIHDLRSEEQKNIQQKIQSHRIELSQLSLDSLAASEVASKFSYGQGSPFQAEPSPFGDFKWDGLNLQAALSLPSYSTSNI